MALWESWDHGINRLIDRADGKEGAASSAFSVQFHTVGPQYCRFGLIQWKEGNGRDLEIEMEGKTVTLSHHVLYNTRVMLSLVIPRTNFGGRMGGETKNNTEIELPNLSMIFHISIPGYVWVLQATTILPCPIGLLCSVPSFLESSSCNADS